MHAGLGRAQRDAQGFCKLGRSQPEVVVQYEDCALIHAETSESAIQLIAIGKRTPDVGWACPVDAQQLDLDGVPASTPGDVDARVDRQSMQPGVESLGIAEPGQISPGLEEHLLDRVLREVAIAEDQSGDRLQPRAGSAGKQREGVMIAPPRSLDELPLVHGHPLGATRLVALNGNDGERDEIIPDSAVRAGIRWRGSPGERLTGTPCKR